MANNQNPFHDPPYQSQNRRSSYHPPPSPAGYPPSHSPHPQYLDPHNADLGYRQSRWRDEEEDELKPLNRSARSPVDGALADKLATPTPSLQRWGTINTIHMLGVSPPALLPRQTLFVDRLSQSEELRRDASSSLERGTSSASKLRYIPCQTKLIIQIPGSNAYLFRSRG
jgi:hypothetical protein